MFSANQFTAAPLLNGLSIATVTLIDQPIENLFGKRAFGRTRIDNRQLHILIASQLSDKEKSVTLYHEVLESAIVTAIRVPISVADFSEAEIDRESYAMHDRLGPASPASLVAMLQFSALEGQ